MLKLEDEGYIFSEDWITEETVNNTVKWYHATLKRHLESLKAGIKVDHNMGHELDFGAGFYITSDLEQACKYINAQVDALNNGMSNEDFFNTDREVGIILEFHIDNFVDIFTNPKYNCHYFSTHKHTEKDIDFAEFVFKNRKNTEKLQHSFDFIYGVQTDDKPTQLMMRYKEGEIDEQQVLEEFRKPYSFKQLSIHNQSFYDIMKIDKVYFSDTRKELEQW